MAQNSITSVEHLREWFFRQDGNLWTLYNGRQTTGSSSQRLGSNWDKSVTKQEAWQRLAEYMGWISNNGASVTVYVTDKKSNTQGGARVFVDLPSRERKAISGIHGKGKSLPDDSSSIYGMIEQEAEKKAERKMERYELHRQIEELADKVENGQSVWERLPDKLIDSGFLDKCIEVIGSRIAQASNQQARAPGRQISMAGFDAEKQRVNEDQEYTEEEPSEGPFYDYNSITPQLKKIQNTFPDTDIHVLIEKLANFIAQNPEAARSFINGME